MKEPRRWLDEPRNVTRLVYGLYAVCALLVVAELFVDRHPHFGIERVFGFYALYGLFGCVALVLIAKLLRRLVGRDEDYYEPPARREQPDD